MRIEGTDLVATCLGLDCAGEVRFAGGVLRERKPFHDVLLTTCSTCRRVHRYDSDDDLYLVEGG